MNVVQESIHVHLTLYVLIMMEVIYVHVKMDTQEMADMAAIVCINITRQTFNQYVTYDELPNLHGVAAH